MTAQHESIYATSELGRVKWAFYGRCSTSKQQDSEDRQRVDIARLEENAGFEIVDCFFDENKSGSTPFDSRPEAKRLLAAAREGTIEGVIVSELDRLGRNPLDMVNTIARFTGFAMGGYVDEGLDLKLFVLGMGGGGRMLDMNNQEDRTLIWFKALQADNELGNYSRRVKSTNRRRLKQGGDLGQPGWAYRWEKNDPNRAAYHAPDMEWLPVVRSLYKHACRTDEVSYTTAHNDFRAEWPTTYLRSKVHHPRRVPVEGPKACSMKRFRCFIDRENNHAALEKLVRDFGLDLGPLEALRERMAAKTPEPGLKLVG